MTQVSHLGEKQLSIYRLEVFPHSFGYVFTRTHTWEKWQKEIFHLPQSQRQYLEKKREAESMNPSQYDKTSIKAGNMDIKFLCADQAEWFPVSVFWTE